MLIALNTWKKGLAKEVLARDKRYLKAIEKLEGQEDTIMTKQLRACLGYWDIPKIKYLLDINHVPSLKQGFESLVGLRVSVERVKALFLLSAAFERLSKFDYLERYPQ